MSVIEVEPLTSELSAEAPAGADLEYDPAYFELEKLAQGTPESEMGDIKKAAEEPEWREVKSAALGLFEKTRDLRVAMLLAVALLQVDGLAGFRDGVGVVRGFIEKLWDQFYPKLDPEDNNDPTARINVLKGFDGDGSSADLYKFKQRLREATLTNSQQRIGKFSYRDIQVAKGETAAPEAKEGEAVPQVPDMNLINAAFEDTTTEDLQAMQATIEESLADLAGLDGALAEKVGGGVGPDLTSLTGVLEDLQKVYQEQLAKRGIGEAPVMEERTGGGGGGGGESPSRGGGGAISGEVSSRADVIRMLEKICEYYERYEPASPVPIFMNRAKRLVTMSFVDLMKDLAPEAMSKIEVFTGEPSGGEQSS
jgi:type VI secretion system protein ImpA